MPRGSGPQATTDPATSPHSARSDAVADPSASKDTAAARLRHRYGPERDPQRSRRLTWILAGTLAIAALLFGTWVGISRLGPTVSAQEISFFVADDQASVEVLLEITMPPGAQADCTLEALDAAFGQVGLLDTRLGPFEDRVNQVRIPIATSAPPVTGTVRSCQLVE